MQRNITEQTSGWRGWTLNADTSSNYLGYPGIYFIMSLFRFEIFISHIIFRFMVWNIIHFGSRCLYQFIFLAQWAVPELYIMLWFILLSQWAVPELYIMLWFMLLSQWAVPELYIMLWFILLSQWAVLELYIMLWFKLLSQWAVLELYSALIYAARPLSSIWALLKLTSNNAGSKSWRCDESIGRCLHDINI